MTGGKRDYVSPGMTAGTVGAAQESAGYVTAPVALLGAALGDLSYLLGLSAGRLNEKARGQIERTVNRLLELMPQ